MKNIDELIKDISISNELIQSTPTEVVNGISKFSKYMKEHPLTVEDIIKFFSDKENKDACESFVRRHPETPYKKYIPK